MSTPKLEDMPIGVPFLVRTTMSEYECVRLSEANFIGQELPAGLHTDAVIIGNEDFTDDVHRIVDWFPPEVVNQTSYTKFLEEMETLDKQVYGGG